MKTKGFGVLAVGVVLAVLSFGFVAQAAMIEQRWGSVVIPSGVSVPRLVVSRDSTLPPVPDNVLADWATRIGTMPSRWPATVEYRRCPDLMVGNILDPRLCPHGQVGGRYLFQGFDKTSQSIILNGDQIADFVEVLHSSPSVAYGYDNDELVRENLVRYLFWLGVEDPAYGNCWVIRTNISWNGFQWVNSPGLFSFSCFAPGIKWVAEQAVARAGLSGQALNNGTYDRLCSSVIGVVNDVLATLGGTLGAYICPLLDSQMSREFNSAQGLTGADGQPFNKGWQSVAIQILVRDAYGSTPGVLAYLELNRVGPAFSLVVGPWTIFRTIVQQSQSQ